MIGAREVALMEEMRGHASRSAALAKIGSIPESNRNRKRSDLLGSLVSHEDGPCDDEASSKHDSAELGAD